MLPSAGPNCRRRCPIRGRGDRALVRPRHKRPTYWHLATSNDGQPLFRRGRRRSMRVLAHSAIVAAAVMLSGSLSAQSKDPTAILAAARQALGGDAKISAVKSFTATGRTRQVRGDNLVPIEFELFVELPDKYLKKDEIPAQETGVTASGFSGDDLLVDPPPPAPLPEPARKTRLSTLKQDFARL